MGDVFDYVFGLVQLLAILVLFVQFTSAYRKQAPVRDLVFWGVLLVTIATFAVATTVKEEIQDQTIVIKREVVHRNP